MYRTNATIGTLIPAEPLWTWWDSICWFFRIRTYQRALRFYKLKNEPQLVTTELVEKWIKKAISKNPGNLPCIGSVTVDRPNCIYYKWEHVEAIIKSLGHALYFENNSKVRVILFEVSNYAKLDSLSKLIGIELTPAKVGLKYFHLE